MLYNNSSLPFARPFRRVADVSRDINNVFYIYTTLILPDTVICLSLFFAIKNVHTFRLNMFLPNKICVETTSVCTFNYNTKCTRDWHIIKYIIAPFSRDLRGKKRCACYEKPCSRKQICEFTLNKYCINKCLSLYAHLYSCRNSLLCDTHND